MPQSQTEAPDTSTGFFPGLVDALKTGFVGTGREIQSDWEKLKQGSMPTGAVDFLTQALGQAIPAIGMLKAGVGPMMSRLTAEGRPSTLQELVTELRNKGQGLRLDNLIATLRNPTTGHEIEGRYGVAGHPYDKLMAYLASIGARPDMQAQYERSFKVPGQGGLTVPDWAANQLRSVPFVEHLFNLYKQGRTDDQVLRLMQSLLPSDMQALSRFRRGG